MSRRVERLIWVKLPTGYAAVGSSLARTRIRPPHSIDRQSLRARIGNLLYLSILAAYTVRSEYACNISPFPRKRLPRKVQADCFRLTIAFHVYAKIPLSVFSVARRSDC